MVGTSGGAVDLAVSTAQSCDWAAVSEVTWIRPSTATRGNGNGATAWVVAPNAGAARSGGVWMAGQRFLVSQDGTEGAVDTDGDLLPDAWEIAHGLNQVSTSGGNGTDGDPDGDQQTNLAEYQQGTNPSGYDRYLAEGVTSPYSTCNWRC